MKNEKIITELKSLKDSLDNKVDKIVEKRVTHPNSNLLEGKQYGIQTAIEEIDKYLENLED